MARRAWNIHDTFRPLEILFKIAGFLPLFWPDFQKCHCKYRVLNALNFLANITCSVAMSHWMLKVSARHFDESNFARSNFVTAVLAYATPVVIVTFGFVLGEKMKQIFRKLHKIDHQVGLITRFFQPS